MKYIMKLQKRPFNKIKNGQKNIEIRLYDKKRKKIKIGDTIEFLLEPEKTKKINVEVTALLNYKKFKDLFDDFPTKYFGYTNKKDLLKRVYKIYTKKEESQNTVLGIRIKLIK